MNPVRVLIVDDEAEFAEALVERLRLRGYQTEAAYSAESGIQMTERIQPDVVLLDFMLPGKTGLEILRLIKQISPGTEVILLTGQGDTPNEHECLGAGALAYVIKPADIGEIVAKIQEAVRQTS